MKKLSTTLIVLGLISAFSGIAIFIFTFYPVISEEIKYQFHQLRSRTALTNQTNSDDSQLKDIQPVDTQFGIVIPKIRASSKIVANVDPFQEEIYQRALTQGVAHAKNTVFPGQTGNIFLFSHSSVNFYEANRYNSVFYLINKMETGDEIDLYYQDEKFTYQVDNKKIVSPENISYLTSPSSKKVLTLMTCWPPGTTLKRLVVTATAI